MKGLRILGASAALLLVLTGCRTIPSDMLPKEPSSSQTPAASAAPSDEPKAQAFAVSFSSEDTLNPYAAKTRVNLDLATLLYSSLTVLDDAFMPQPSAAATVQAADPLHWTAVLREDALFSDGSRITPTTWRPPSSLPSPPPIIRTACQTSKRQKRVKTR